MNTLKKKARPAILLTAGVIFIIIGIIQDDYHDTLLKAVTICLECIGIG